MQNHYEINSPPAALSPATDKTLDLLKIPRTAGTHAIPQH